MLKRDLSTPENVAFWEHVERTAESVKAWPAWKRNETPDTEWYPPAIVQFEYTNYKGESSTRTVSPIEIKFTWNEWHPKPAQWLLIGYDHDKGQNRTFPFLEIVNWRPYVPNETD